MAMMIPPITSERREVDERSVRPVEPRCVAVTPLEVVDEVQHEQRAHSVVGESFPHLHHEQKPEPARMAQEGRVVENRWSVQCDTGDFCFLECSHGRLSNNCWLAGG